MEGLSVLVVFIIGVVLRFAVPIAATILVIGWLRQLDNRWQTESEKQGRLVLNADELARSPRCWEVKECPPERMTDCPAHLRPDIPCWQIFRAKDGQLREACLACLLFRNAVAPKVVARAQS